MIGIIDYDFIKVKRGTPIPSLAAMQMAAYLKSQNKSYQLITNIDSIDSCEEVYFFTEKMLEEIPVEYIMIDNFTFYGTHFETMPDIVYHMRPDVKLYTNIIDARLSDKKCSVEKALSLLDSTYYQAKFNGENLPLPPIEPRKRFYIYDKDFLSYSDCWEILDKITKYTPTTIYFVNPINCHTMKQFLILRENYEIVSRSNKIYLDYYVPLDDFDVYFGKYRLKLLGEITSNSNINIYLGKNYQMDLYNDLFYIKNIFYNLNLLYSYWSRNIPIHASIWDVEGKTTEFKEVYKAIEVWANTKNKKITFEESFRTKAQKEILKKLLDKHPVFKNFLPHSRDSLKNTRGVWRIP